MGMMGRPFSSFAEIVKSLAADPFSNEKGYKLNRDTKGIQKPQTRNAINHCDLWRFEIGLTGFEPATSRPPGTIVRNSFQPKTT